MCNKPALWRVFTYSDLLCRWLADGGFMGFYAGSSEYEIIQITENLLTVRMVQANEPLFAWYHTFTPVKPEQK